MPPFCAPSPSFLLSEPPPVSPPPPEQREEDIRAQMVASLVMALSDAEVAAAEQSDANNAEHQELLATQAYNSLCFDFPIVPTNGLAALASAFRSRMLDVGTPVFPITNRFTAGLRYLFSIEFMKQTTLDGAVATTEDVYAQSQGETISDSESRCLHLCSLCGYVFLSAPALRIGLAHKDGGASLHEFLAAFDAHEQDYFPEDSSTSDTGVDKDPHNRTEVSLGEYEVNDSTNDRLAIEMDDDGSDWEDLETFVPPPELASSEEPTVSRQGEEAGWSDLWGKVAYLTGLAPFGVINTSSWKELQLTDHLIQALNSLRTFDCKETEADLIMIAKVYVDLLSDHLLLGWSASSSEVSAVVSSLLVLVQANGEFKQRSSKIVEASISRQSWELIVLTAVAKICSKVGGYPVRKIFATSAGTTFSKQPALKGSREQGSLPSSAFVRSLWQSVFSNVQFLEVQLTEALAESDSFSKLEMILWILCFFVKCAPANADLRAILLEGGIFRIVLQLFVKVGTDSQMEPLRHFLLLSMAASSALAEFSAQVPSFREAMSSPDFFVEGSYTRAHAVIWPLLLRAPSWQSSTSKTPARYSNQVKSSEAESMVVATFSGVVEAVADNTNKKNPSSFLRELAWLHWLLLLLEEAASASSGSTFKLWQRGSPLDINISRCQVALGGLLVCENESASSTLSPRQKTKKKSEDLGRTQSSDLVDDDSITHIDDESEESTVGSLTTHGSELIAVQEKLKELLPSMLLQLKRLSTLTKENQGAKID